MKSCLWFDLDVIRFEEPKVHTNTNNGTYIQWWRLFHDVQSYEFFVVVSYYDIDDIDCDDPHENWIFWIYYVLLERYSIVGISQVGEVKITGGMSRR